MTLFTFAEKGGVDEGTVLLVGILLLAIFMPTSFFFAYQINKRKHALPIKIRYPSITFWLTVFFCLKQITSSGIIIWLWRNPQFADWVIYKILLILDNIFLYLFLYLTVWRLWRIKYDLNWSKATLQNNAWRLLINEGEAQQQDYGKTSWYFKHKVTCCGPSYLCPFIPLIIVLCAINIPVFLYGYSSALTVFVSRSTFTATVLIMCLLYILTPKQITGRAPKFALNKELKMLFIINILVLLVSIAGFIYDLYFSSTSEAFEAYSKRNVNVLVEESLYFAGLWFLCMFQTFYVLIKTGEYIPFYLSRRKRGKSHIFKVMDGHNTRELSEVFNHPKLYPWFFEHLASEFSISVVLALIEFIQFQRYCSVYYKSHDSDYIQLKSDRIRMPHNMPQSSIVFMNASSHSKANLTLFFNYALEKYHKLYCKYFNNPGSKLQLDFTPKIKQYFDGVLGNERKWLYENDEINTLPVLMQHLDKSIAEIYHLADDSFRRFVQVNSHRLFQEIPELYMNTMSA